MAIHDDSNSVRLPIPSNALDYAQKISAFYDDRTIRQRVFYNAIAVVILHNYFEILGVTTHYQDSDLSNPPVQLAGDSSTLSYDNLGQLECRGLPHESTEFSVPPETWIDRLGYVFIGVDLDTRYAILHGYLKQVSTQVVHLKDLQPIEAMV